ncbi:MAG: H-type lectin domain-containing protein [Candidatus Thiodiazotropha sp.]
MYNDSSNSGLVPFRMCSATVSFDQFTAGWTLARFEGTPEPKPRIFEQWIDFATPFSNVPLVQPGLVGFDIDNRDTARLKVRAERITANGFMLVIETWCHTRVYGADVSWLAIGT